MHVKGIGVPVGCLLEQVLEDLLAADGHKVFDGNVSVPCRSRLLLPLQNDTQEQHTVTLTFPTGAMI